MKAIDTNIIVSLLVILEVVWVLESVYEIERGRIIDALRELLLMPVLRFEQQPAMQKFLQNAQKNSHDLSDLLIVHSAGEQGCEAVITCDGKA